MGTTPAPPRAEAPPLSGFRHRIGRLRDPALSREIGYVVTRVVVHWDTVGPHHAPLHVNPAERLEWRVHYDDAERPELFCDDAAVRGVPVLATLADGRLRVGERDLRVRWLDGSEADEAWRDLAW